MPAPARHVAPAVVAVAVLASMAGCGSSAVSVDAPELDGEDAAVCADLLAQLPDTLAGEQRRQVDPQDAPAAAWGDPAIVLTCGVEEPAAYDEFASCIEVDGTGWFAPDDELSEVGTDLQVTELVHHPRVAVLVPPEHRGRDSVLADLARPIRSTLDRGSRCH